MTAGVPGPDALEDAMRRTAWALSFAWLLAVAPSAALACCAAVAAHWVWPWDGMENVPMDAAVLLYGSTYEQPFADWSVSCEAEDGEAVTVATDVEMMTSGYFLIVATPKQPLAPGTLYTCTFTRSGVDVEEAKVFSFRTAVQGAEWGPPPVPDLDYEGLGVPMMDAGGGHCVSSVTEEAGALALTVSGEGLSARMILIEVQDGKQTKVFDTLLSGQYDLDRQLALGGGLCSAHFEVDPCEHYCVRAAAMDHQGVPGPWTEWSCSDEIGDWVCGDPDGSVVFGDDIEQGKTFPPEPQACVDRGNRETGGAAQDGGDAGRAESAGSRAEEGSGAGCAMATSQPTATCGVMLPGILLALLWLARRRGGCPGPVRALVSLILFGCPVAAISKTSSVVTGVLFTTTCCRVMRGSPGEGRQVGGTHERQA